MHITFKSHYPIYKLFETINNTTVKDYYLYNNKTLITIITTQMVIMTIK